MRGPSVAAASLISMWADLVAWLGSPAGTRIVQGAIVPALAVLAAGFVAALIGRAAMRSVSAGLERERATAAVAGLVEAAAAALQGAPTGADRRRIARLRTEADVRTRMLALSGADLAASWAAEQTVAAVQQADAAPDAAQATVGRMRDRLIEWTARPGRARKLFAADAAPAQPGPRRRSAPAQPTPAAAPTPAAEEPPAPGADVAAEGAPDPEAAEAQTAPVLVQRTRRTFGPVGPAAPAPPVVPTAPVASEPDGTRADARPARHALPDAAPTPAPAPTVAEQAAVDPAKSATPSWLDTYDDEAQVTQNMNLKTPPPVAAAAIRDRAPSGADIVPRP